MKLILFFCLTFLPSICSGQTKPIGEEPVNLEKFDFRTQISVLYPDKYKSREYDIYYEIPAKFSLLGYHYVIKETIFENKFEQDLKKAVGIEYRQQSSSTATVLAVFGKQLFNKISIATTLNNKIKIVGAVAMEISRSESEALIKHLTAIYGSSTRFRGEFGRVFNIYEWKSKDRTFRYVPIFNDESNSLKIDIDQNNKTIKPGEKEPHLEGYFYLIKNEFVKDTNRTRTGDFAYLNKN